MNGYHPIDMDEEEWIQEFRESMKRNAVSPETLDGLTSTSVGNTVAQEWLPNKCECGADSIGISKHSDYCPKHEA